jgi:voltage-gated potassium channel
VPVAKAWPLWRDAARRRAERIAHDHPTPAAPRRAALSGGTNAVPVPPRRATRRIDRHWLRATAFTLVLVGLVAAAMGADWRFSATAIAACAVGFGFFYLVFPGGSHFGITVANTLAVYVCVFVYFHEANFPDAPDGFALTALGVPVAGFLFGCLLRRRQLAGLIRARRHHELTHLPRMSRWLPGLLAVGLLSFLVPRLSLGGPGQGIALLTSSLAIAALVVWAARDVVLLLMDIALVFETVAARIDRLLMPVMAFLTFYSLLVVGFACFYRIAQMSLGGPMFLEHGQPRQLSFSEALYFSVTTLATVGYGDITPVGPLARALATVEVVAGLLLLLFGFGEIMRSGGPDTEHRRHLRRGTDEPE